MDLPLFWFRINQRRPSSHILNSLAIPQCQLKVIKTLKIDPLLLFSPLNAYCYEFGLYSLE
jgi:hypothetical protein